jgi:hypothetical protein
MKRNNSPQKNSHERKKTRLDLIVAMIALLCLGLAACHGCSENGGAEDDSSSGTIETDGTGETETQTGDTLSTESESDPLTASDTVTQTKDTQSDTRETDTKPTDTATETDTDLPEGCQLLTPATANFSGWTGREAIDADHVVWMTLEDGDTTVLMSHRLSTGERVELLRHTYPSVIEAPVVRGSNIYYEEQITRGVSETREIFGLNIDGSNERRLTNNDYSEALVGGGECFHDKPL